MRLKVGLGYMRKFYLKKKKKNRNFSKSIIHTKISYRIPIGGDEDILEIVAIYTIL